MPPNDSVCDYYLKSGIARWKEKERVREGERRSRTLTTGRLCSLTSCRAKQPKRLTASPSISTLNIKKKKKYFVENFCKKFHLKSLISFDRLDW